MGHPSFRCVFLLALGLASVWGRPEDTLRKISDLADKDFGHNFPRHGLNLLYWFSREFITFDNNDNMQPAKDPKLGAFGFHYYGNKEDLLPSLRNQRGYAYYTVGNLFDDRNLPQSEKMPDYVSDEFGRSKNLDSRDQNNKDRIVVRRTPHGAVDRVYVTQHYDYDGGHGSAYDPENTYGVGAELVRAVRNLPRESFLERFAPRSRAHYALCHPERAAGPAVDSEECRHGLSGGSSSSGGGGGALACLCCVALALLAGCFAARA